MSEPPPDASFSVRDAVDTIDRATAFAEPLRRRTEGVTITLWGFVTACILLTNGIADDVYGLHHGGGWQQIVSSFLWLPWAGLGVLGTHAVWHIAEVAVRRPEPGLRRSPAALLAWLTVLVAIVVLAVLVVPLNAPGFFIALLGVFWLAIGGLDLYKATPTGRRTIVSVGALIVIAGAAYGWIMRATPEVGWHHFEAVGVLVAGVIPMLGGILQALRG